MAHRSTLDRLRDPSTCLTGARAFALAIVAALLALAAIRLTWPIFSRVPFFLLFGAVYVTARWGTRPAGWLAVGIASLGSPLASPVPDVDQFVPLTIAVFAICALVANHLITGRRQAEARLRASEEKLREAQKMEAVGQLVAGVAHNFNNVLTIAMGYTDLLLDGRGADDPDRAALEEIRKATARGASLTRQLLAFSEQKDIAPARTDVSRALIDLRELLTRAIREDIALSIETTDAPATVLIDQRDFEQLVLNLVSNARDALPTGGHIWIEIARQRLDASNSPPELVNAPGDYVRLAVRDDGIGMPPEVQAHLFEPFFTTKEVGEGTGLGLATVYALVRRHKGGIHVTSAFRAGTTVTLFLPLARGQVLNSHTNAAPADRSADVQLTKT